MPAQEVPVARPPEQWLTEAFAQRMSEALELMTGETPQVAWRSAGSVESPPDLLWWEQPLSIGKQALVWVGAAEPSWSQIGKHVLSAAGIEESDAADARSTYLEILGQALSGLARDIGAQIREEVNCELGSEAQPPGGVSFAVVEVTLAVGQPLSVWFAPASELLELLAQAREPAQRTTEAPGKAVAAEAAAGGAPQTLPVPVAEPLTEPNKKTLELLMEVEMPVSISFGRAQLPLRDVLKLTTGSIIELDRTVIEPVEVIVNNCVIARGEVVVVDGNYGVRIQEIISRQERLRTLK